MVHHTHKLKLTYFNSIGRGETARLALFVGGVDFEDKRIEYGELPSLKPSLPFGQLPTLEVDGVQIAQSLAHITYAAKVTGLLPDCPVQLAKVYQMIGSLQDLWEKAVHAAFYEPDEQKKKKLLANLGETYFPFFLERLEKLVKRDGKNGHMVGDAMTIADLYLYCTFDWIFNSGLFNTVDKNILDRYDTIKQVMNKVKQHPKVQEWYKMKH